MKTKSRRIATPKRQPEPPHPDVISAQIRRACGETIHMLRKRTGIAQEKFASQAGIDRGHMGSLDRGEHTPSLEILLRLLPTLGVSLSKFVVVFETALRRITRNGDRNP